MGPNQGHDKYRSAQCIHRPLQGYLLRRDGANAIGRAHKSSSRIASKSKSAEPPARMLYDTSQGRMCCELSLRMGSNRAERLLPNFNETSTALLRQSTGPSKTGERPRSSDWLLYGAIEARVCVEFSLYMGTDRTERLLSVEVKTTPRAQSLAGVVLTLESSLSLCPG